MAGMSDKALNLTPPFIPASAGMDIVLDATVAAPGPVACPQPQVPLWKKMGSLSTPQAANCWRELRASCCESHKESEANMEP